MHEFASRSFETLVTLDADLEQEFEARLRESSSLAVRVAYSVLRQRQDAEEIAQEAFAKAYRCFSQLRDRDSFRAWLVRMTWRLAIDRWRSDRRRTGREQSGAREGPAPLDHACGAEIAADAAAHLTVCAACRRMFDEQLRLMQDLDQQLELALAIDPSARFVPDVLARVERSVFRRRTALWWSGPAAAAAVLILVTFGSLRSGARQTADRSDPVVPSHVSSAPVADRTPSNAAPPTSPGAQSRRIDVRRRVDRPRRIVVQPRRRIEAAVVVPATQSRAIARYLALVRRGALDTSALIRSDAAGVLAPTDLVIAPLSVQDLAVADMESGPGVDRRGPESR